MGTWRKSNSWPMAAAFLLTLLACSPTYNWREVRGGQDGGAGFTVLLPGKPASYNRPVNLGGTVVDMHMTGTETNGISFAVATAELPDATRAGATITAMAATLLANIGAQASTPAKLPGNMDAWTPVLDLDAHGSSNGQSRRLVARLAVRGSHVFQVMMLGDEKSFADDNIETFFASFKPS